MDTDRLRELVEGNDLDGLIRYVDGLCASRDWDGMLELRRWCYEAAERGKQLWAAAQFAEYRLALEAPAPYAAQMADEGVSRFTLGPLWEVAASTHPWSDLEPHLGESPVRTLVAHERSIRGDQLGDITIDEDVLAPTLELAAWEPGYAVAVYRGDKADFPEPSLPAMVPTALPSPVARITDERGEEALRALITPWVDSSNGRADIVTVDGSAFQAVRTLGVATGSATLLDPAQAAAFMAWTAASGGAHGRRRGTAVGRNLAWWAVAALADLPEEDLLDPDEIGEAADAITWYRWDPGIETQGWSCHLAAELNGRAWALSAVDAI